MSLEMLLAQFDGLIQRPADVAKLDAAILQWAVEGRLGTQCTNDEPVAELLKRIKVETDELVKAKKISKPKKSPSIKQSEIPYDLPQSWRWVRLPEIYYSHGQKKPNKTFTYIDVSSIDNQQGVIGDDLQILAPGEAPSRARKLVKNGTVIYSTVRPYLLNIAMVDRDFDPEPIVSTAFAIMHPFSGVFNRYLYYYLRSQPFIDFVESEMSGMAYPAISDAKLNKGLFPLPPYEEQKRIVARVDALLGQTAVLAQQLSAIEEERRGVNTAVLHQLTSVPTQTSEVLKTSEVFRAFDRLYVEPETIDALKQAILQLAVQGRLVPQDPNDEPASLLLARIKEVKTKLLESKQLMKDKKFSIHLKKEPPYTIPQNWKWTRLQDLFEISRGGSPRPSGDPRYFGGDIPWITVAEITKDEEKYLLSTKDTLTEEGQNKSRTISPDDLLLTNSGATLGVPKISQITGCINDGVALLRQFHQFNMNDYAYLFLSSQTIAFRNIDQGMGQPNLNTSIIAGWYFPCPPLLEQERIVAKVDELFALCDQLAGQVTVAETARLHLRDALLAAASRP